MLVAIGSFWLLVALGRAQLGLPSSTRYIYTGVILIVLIFAEVVRDASVSPRALGIAGVIALFALVANIRLLTDGENSLRTASRIVSAELGALLVAGRIAPAGLVVDPAYAPQLFAGQYSAAIDAIRSSWADSLSQLLGEPEQARSAADTLLVCAGVLQISSTLREPANRRARPRRVRHHWRLVRSLPTSRERSRGRPPTSGRRPRTAPARRPAIADPVKALRRRL